MSEYHRYICSVCGHVYDEAEGDPENGIPPGTRWEALPENWSCSECGVGQEEFELQEPPY